MAWEFSGIYTVQSCCQSVLGLGGGGALGISTYPPVLAETGILRP